jgi:ribonuclease Z
MDVVLLGTGCPLPDANRAGPATLVRMDGRNLLVDCGRAVFMRLTGAAVSPLQLDAILLTHLHSDHTQDLSDLITMRWAMSPEPLPLKVYGPPGTSRFVARTLTMMADDIGYRIAHHADLNWEPQVDVTEVEQGHVMDGVTTAPTDHGVVRPTIGYRFESGGAAVAIGGDSIPCEGLDKLCAGASIYVQTVLRRQLVEAVPSRRFQDVLDYHSSTEDAGRTSARAGVRTLAMTHMIPAPVPGTEKDWSDDASPHFDGEVLVGTDLMTIRA